MKSTQKNLNLVSATVLTMFLSACASGPTESELSNADYGRNISVEECKSIAEQTLISTLKDPDSAQFRHSDCYRGYWGSIPIKGMDVAFGWLQLGEFNAKNSYGGYVGFQRYKMLMKDGEVVRYCTFSDQGYCIPVG